MVSIELLDAESVSHTCCLRLRQLVLFLQLRDLRLKLLLGLVELTHLTLLQLQFALRTPLLNEL